MVPTHTLQVFLVPTHTLQVDGACTVFWQFGTIVEPKIGHHGPFGPLLTSRLINLGFLYVT